MTDKNSYVVAGLMSGTSLDGIDVALCRFTAENDKWIYEITGAETLPYSNEWKNKLVEAETCSGLDLIQLHKEYGTFLGAVTLGFLKHFPIRPGLIASHGHTIFHQPEKRLTFQLGDGAYIAAKTGITTVSDFRNLDVALGGQGAPLVPIGDELLFGDYDQCLNLGGFANISFNDSGTRKAFDICPVNIVLNYLMKKYFGTGYDKDGNQGRSGKVNEDILAELNRLEFYRQKPPKSLGKEWVLEQMFPLIEKSGLSPEDKIKTIYNHIAIQLAGVINSIPGNRVLVTGGGAYNQYLLGLTGEKTKKEIIVPPKMVIEFKEALIFAFLGLLRFRNKNNCLASVTGAAVDNSGGVIHYINSTFT